MNYWIVTAFLAVVLLLGIPGAAMAADLSVSGSILLAPPSIDFTGTPTSGPMPLAVAFTATNTGGAVDTWDWNFGDGTAHGTVQNASHTYTTAGTYTVTLNATNAGGSDVETKTGYVTVNGNVDFSITGLVNCIPANAIFAKEPNTITVTNIKNGGTSAASNIVVKVYASDVDSGNTPIATATIPSLAAGASVSLTGATALTDPTIRTVEGSVIYTAKVDPDNLIAESNEANNNKTSAAKSVKFNGYKGKRYWDYGSDGLPDDIRTKQTFDLNGDIVYYTQPDSQYKGVGFTTRTETWSAANLPIPAGATVEKAMLFFTYNWDQTPGGFPNLVTEFNGNTINLGTPYRDWANFGAYADYEYGLYPVYDVTSIFNTNGDNTLVTNPGNGGADNKVALYPSTLAVIYSDASKTRKQIFINEEYDYLGVSQASYGTTLEEATAYAPFSGMTIDTGSVQSAHWHSFATNAGPAEGNVFFNGNSLGTNVFTGTASTADAKVFDVKSYLTATGNEAGVQGTESGGMGAIQQFLVVEYAAAAPVAGFSATPLSGTAPLTVAFTDASTGAVTGYAWDFDNNGVVDSTEKNPNYTYTSAGTYTVKLAVTGTGGSDDEVKTDYITVTALPTVPVANFTYTPASGSAPLTVAFTDASTGAVTGYAWDFDNNGVVDSTDKNPTFTYAAAGSYTVNLTVTGPGGSDEEVKANIITVGSATITVTVGPASIDFGSMTAGVDETGSTQVAVTTDGGTAWSVTAAANNGGYMKAGTTQLAGAFQLANGGGAFQAMTSNFANFMTGTANEDRTDTANVRQAIGAGDQPGNYSITLTFTGGFA